jgi:gamma-glutamyl hercynylcysteine S-oxide hydrolase
VCRIAARVGPPAPLSLPLYDVPRSLSVLAYAPRELRSGHVNVDGTGIVWFEDPGGDPRPLRYRTQAPPWGDQALVELAPRLRSPIVLGAVRSTTPGLPNGTAFVHPFTAGGLAGTHNGYIDHYRARVARPLLAEVSDEAIGLLEGNTDAAALFLLAADGYAAGEGLLGAAVRATGIAARVCERVGATATLTLVLADAGGVAAVNAAVGRPANSLYTAEGRVEGDAAEARWLASEPLDPSLDWTPVPDGGTATLTLQEP